MPERADPALESLAPASGWRDMSWRERLTSRFGLGLGYALAAILTVASVWMAAAAPVNGPVGPPSKAILIVLCLNLGLITAMGAAAVWRVFGLVSARGRDAGARLHLRFVALFATAAVAPAIIVAVVFGVLVTQGVDSWFSHRIRTVVENSTIVARTYVNSQVSSLHDDLWTMANDVNGAAPAFKQSPVEFSRFLDLQASYRGFPAVYLIDHDGRVLARAEVASPPPFLAPPAATIDAADKGDIPVHAFDATDQIRALVRLKAYDDAYLYVVRPVEKGMLAHLREAESSLLAYRDTATNRGRIKAAFELSYLETALLVLIGAVWVGLGAASSISAPVARLVQAADRVAGGDLTARVTVDKGPEEITDLAHSFNRMTSDLQAQQAALRAASEEAEQRRQFLDTVLSGVSAGVIGLDPEGRIEIANRQAQALLGLTGDDARGLLIGQAAPELAGVAMEAAAMGGEAEVEIDVVRDGETRRLRVRASGHADGGLVLTFDDITRLVAAQRNAAWKDVARRIAHEIKNPLTPIQLSAERIRRRYRKDIQQDLETFDRCTDTIIRQVGDIGRMVDEFSAFARMPAPTFAEADAAEMLRRAVFAQRVVDPDTDVELDGPIPEASLVCDARMIGQALTNVLKNAGEAVAARRTAEPGLRGRIRARLRLDDDTLAFEVEDNGVGLPTKDRDRLTEPYVTTREKGTGLGLAIVKRILEDHGGELVLTDAADLPGARAILRLPRLAASRPATSEGVVAA
jgi:two-component system nitrogen regulation sensor histidine kinase NtrY